MMRPIVSEFLNSLDTLSIDRVYELSREVYCRFTRLSYECGAKSIKECPGRTLEVYKELSKMMAPSYCQFFPEKDEEHPTDVSDGLSRKVAEKRSRPSSPEL
ncbi:hypothetical protein BaRGS_00019631 [Batillaria attramentaria]|uniref:Uncharacterized protein n=1 Tax=Batillaria attramentaria TaxID=370345 RepID=A0ABD0KQG8_9CAEN